MRRSVQPSRPSAKTCCFFSSLQTLAIAAEAITPHAVVNVPEGVSVGRFAGDHHWPVLGDRLRAWDDIGIRDSADLAARNEFYVENIDLANVKVIAWPPPLAS